MSINKAKSSNIYLAQSLREQTLKLLTTISDDQHPLWGGGEMTASAYDTAWVAMIRDHHDRDRLAFPKSFEWLMSNQGMDGSWGIGLEVAYTIVPTLAALLAILKAPVQNEKTRQAAELAENYLHVAFAHWTLSGFESIGFEVLVPSILWQIEGGFNISFDFEAKDELIMLFAEKMSMAATPDLLYTGKSNLIFSLEAFGPRLDLEVFESRLNFKRLKNLQATNGSYGCSPASTAAVLIYNTKEWDVKAAEWLEHLSERGFGGQQGAMPNAFSIDTFELAWSVYNLARSSGGIDFLPMALTTTLTTWLKKCLVVGDNEGGSNFAQVGASFAQLHTGIPCDSDDTSVVIAALNLIQPTSLTSNEPLIHFERDDFFACFEIERGPSISSNAHVLSAFLTNPSQVAQYSSQITKLVDYLYSQRNAEAGYWQDKWHLSPYYATSRSVLALSKVNDETVLSKLLPTVEWVLATQSSRDGGWGFGESSTLEESAYALQILQTLKDISPLLAIIGENRYEQVITRGVTFLWRHLSEYSPIYGRSNLPKLWVGKELYCPARVVFSAVLSVLSNYYQS